MFEGGEVTMLRDALEAGAAALIYIMGEVRVAEALQPFRQRQYCHAMFVIVRFVARDRGSPSLVRAWPDRCPIDHFESRACLGKQATTPPPQACAPTSMRPHEDAPPHLDQLTT